MMVAAPKRYAALAVAAVLAMPGLFATALKKYFVFAGRASRLEFFAFVIITGIIGYVLDEAAKASDIADAIGWTFWWAILPPTISVTVRRLHDFGASGRWSVIVFFPYLTGLALLIADFVYPTGEEATAAENALLLNYLVLFFVGIFSIACIAAWMVLILKGGDKGGNKHGAPLQIAPRAA